MVSNTDRKRHIWEFFEMSLRGEVDPAKTEFFWHWLMFPLLDMFGPELVYAIGLKALGFPPTWVDAEHEAVRVEAAIVEYLIDRKR